jgi:hypothetical protein
LHAGDRIITGSLLAAVVVEPAATYRATFTPIGEVAVITGSAVAA